MNDKKLAVTLAETIDDFARSSGFANILEEVNIYAQSHVDGAVTFAIDWDGTEDQSNTAQAVLNFVHAVKDTVVKMGKETVEQLPPHSQIYSGAIKVVYRFRMWNEPGEYETFERQLENK